MNITDFKLLVANGSSNLSTQVSLHLKEGWELEGNHQVTHYVDKNGKDTFQYTQVVVKVDE